MRIKALFWICAGMFLCCACHDNFDNYYHEVGNESIGKSVIQALEDHGEFHLFLDMIRRAELERTLTQSGLYTCLAPRDQQVQKWLDAKGWTVETMPLRTVNQFVNYHFVKGMRYYYDFEKKYQDAVNWDDSPEMFTRDMIVDTREAGKIYPAKKVRIFTSSYLKERGDDYKKMTGVEPKDFMVENVPVSETQRDIPTANGVIHVLEGPLMLMPRLDEAMADDPELSVAMGLFNRFAGTELLADDKGKVDSVENKYFDLSMKKGRKVLNIGEEAVNYTLLMPNDEALMKYFAPYLTPDQWIKVDSIPDEFVIAFFKSLAANTGDNVWGLSDIDRNSPYFTSTDKSILPLKNNISSLYTGAVQASNGLIYKLNKVPEIPLMSSVEFGYYLHARKFREWDKMVEKDKISLGLFGTSPTYQHLPKIVLLQPDGAEVWGEDGVAGFEDKYQDTLAWRLSAGFLNGRLVDGKLEHRFYQGPRGALLCEQKEGKWQFVDFEDNVVRLVEQDPIYETETGSAIFAVEDIPEQLDNQDTTRLMYRKYIRQNGELNNFRLLCDKANMKELLDKKGNTYYTVFAPNDKALTYERVDALSEEEAKQLCRKCIVEGKRIFTDGFADVNVVTMGRLKLTLSGSWESFRISALYDRAGIVTGKCNLQASNGVLHIVDHLLEK